MNTYKVTLTLELEANSKGAIYDKFKRALVGVGDDEFIVEEIKHES